MLVTIHSLSHEIIHSHLTYGEVLASHGFIVLLRNLDFFLVNVSFYTAEGDR